MKLKPTALLVYSLVVFTAVSCEVTSSSIGDSTSEETSISTGESTFSYKTQDSIKEEGYSWLLNEGEAYKGDVQMTISSNNVDDELKLYVDGQDGEKYRSSTTKMLATLSYELDPEHPANTESVEACQNTVRLNGKLVDLLHNEEGLSVDINTDNLLEGENIITITIGYVYLNKEFSKATVGYKLGWGDDFRIRKVGVQLSDGTFIKPTKMVGYYCDEKIKKYVTEEMTVDPDEYYWLGDGWGDGDYVAHINHFDPAYERPFQIDYYINYSSKANIKNYTVDTTDLVDGNHTFTGLANNEHVLQNKVLVDNTAPAITHNLYDNMRINKNYPFSMDVVDGISGIESTVTKLDGTIVESVNLKDLVVGPHSISVTSKDKAGNATADTVCFNIVDSANYLDADSSDGSIRINKNYQTSNTFTEYEKSTLTATTEDEANQTSTEEVVSQTYTVDVKDKNKDVLISYNGSTQASERLLFEAYNQSTKKYETVHIGENGVNKFKITPKKYLNTNSKIQIKVSPLKTDNGSNRMFWASDIQYLAKTITQFSDLKDDYNKLMSYMADEYEDGKAAYMINTGDIVDDNPSYESAAIAEWKHASAAFEYVDNVGMPYGVCAGNHDVGSSVSTVDYGYYGQYFGTNRTGLSNYYGQSLNNNACHYDLITIGDYDFIMLYLGYGVEGTLETIEWANKVLKAYPDRNAFLCTHEYLDSSGAWHDDSRAETMYNEIVVPNENVKVVMCGHTDSSVVTRRKVSDTRVVFELISCYQFVETTTDDQDINKTKHLTNGYKCNGEGWIKEISVKDDGHLFFHTFSPVLDNNYFVSNNGITYLTNDYVLKLDLNKKKHVLETVSFSAYQLGSTLSNSTTDGNYTRQNNDSIVYVSDSTGAYTFVD